MKKILSILLLCFYPLITFAQVRDKVCIVRPDYSDTIVKMINDFKPRLAKLGIENPDQYVEDFLKRGIFGSGFVYVDANGKNYIITNRHVISDAATSTVIFEDTLNKTKKEISGMKIIAADSSLDLAILEFPEGEQPFSTGFQFYKGNISDGDSVYTAGYPGLIGKPTWQLGTGIITNASVEVEEMIKPELSSLIQHSAQIDGGNSGGPLLIKTGDDKYEVVGINTWKLINRQDTNFAIPSTTILKFIQNVLSDSKIIPQDSQSVITEKATNLHKSLNKYSVTFEELVDYISIDYIEKEGKTIFDKVINRCDTNSRKTINLLLEKYSPIESVRYAIGWYIFNEFHKNEYVTDTSKKSSVNEVKLPQLNPPEQIEGTNYWETRLYNGATRQVLVITWTYTNGDWQILSVKNKSAKKADLEASKKANAEYLKKALEVPEGKGTKFGKFTLYLPFHAQFAYGKNILSKQYPANLCSNTVNANIKIHNLFSATITGDIMEESIYIHHQGDKMPTSQIAYVEPFIGGQLQLPFYINKAIIMPYLNLQGGVELSNFDNLNTEFLGKGNLGTTFFLSLFQNKFGIYIDSNYYYKLFINDLDKNDYGINLSIGIAF